MSTASPELSTWGPAIKEYGWPTVVLALLLLFLWKWALPRLESLVKWAINQVDLRNKFLIDLNANLQNEINSNSIKREEDQRTFLTALAKRDEVNAATAEELRKLRESLVTVGLIRIPGKPKKKGIGQ